MSLIGKYRTLVDILERHASERPDSLASVFLEKDGSTKSLTFAELSRRARAIASRIQSAGAKGRRVILMYEPGLEFIEAILACFFAKAVAVPVMPTRNVRELPRLAAILGDAGCRLVLTSTATEAAARRAFNEAKTARPDVSWLYSDTIPDAAAADFRSEIVEPSSLAFLQYTSGSTGAPKAVMVTHGNLFHNEQMMKAAFGHDETTVMVGWLPVYHDMGLIGQTFQPLFLGVKSVFSSPMTFLMNPVTWLRAISTWRGTTSPAPSFAYELCVQRISPEEMDGVDLSSWKLAGNGAEPVKSHVIKAFSNKFAPYGFREEAFYPCYGMAEATLFITGGMPLAKKLHLRVDPNALAKKRILKDESASTVLVGCGRSHAGQVVRIVDPETLQRLPAGQIGEIWVSGPSVAAGYWNRPEATVATFQAHTADGEGPFLRTGDLGCWQEGELFVTGRLKDLIIIRGRNHYPDDIERTVYHGNEALRPGGAAAFTVNDAEEEETKLVIVAEVHRTFVSNLDAQAHEAVLSKVRKDVAEAHGLRLADLVLIKSCTLPKTTSGKVRRSQCRELYLENKLERAANKVARAA